MREGPAQTPLNGVGSPGSNRLVSGILFPAAILDEMRNDQLLVITG